MEHGLSHYFVTSVKLCQERSSPFHKYVLADIARRDVKNMVPCGVLKVELVITDSREGWRLMATKILRPGSVTVTPCVQICHASESSKGHWVLYQSWSDVTQTTCTMDRFIAAGLAITPATNSFSACGAAVLFALVVGDDASNLDVVNKDALKSLKRHASAKSWKFVQKQQSHTLGDVFPLMSGIPLSEALESFHPQLSRSIADLTICLTREREKNMKAWDLEARKFEFHMVLLREE